MTLQPKKMKKPQKKQETNFWNDLTANAINLRSKYVSNIHNGSAFSKKHFISCLLHANVCLPTVEQLHAD